MMSTSKEFYEAMKYRVEAGQFKMEDIIADLDTAWGKGLITAEQYHELKSRAFETCDPNYDGNRIATSYDEKQDIEITSNTLTSLDNFEMILDIYDTILGGIGDESLETFSLSSRASNRTAIGDSYTRMIVKGLRTFDSVPTRVKQEVAERLIEMGREDLITDVNYLPNKIPVPQEVILDKSEIALELGVKEEDTLLVRIEPKEAVQEVETYLDSEIGRVEFVEETEEGLVYKVIANQEGQADLKVHAKENLAILSKCSVTVSSQKVEEEVAVEGTY